MSQSTDIIRDLEIYGEKAKVLLYNYLNGNCMYN